MNKTEERKRQEQNKIMRSWQNLNFLLFNNLTRKRKNDVGRNIYYLLWEAPEKIDAKCCEAPIKSLTRAAAACLFIMMKFSFLQFFLFLKIFIFWRLFFPKHKKSSDEIKVFHESLARLHKTVETKSCLPTSKNHHDWVFFFAVVYTRRELFHQKKAAPSWFVVVFFLRYGKYRFSQVDDGNRDRIEI